MRSTKWALAPNIVVAHLESMVARRASNLLELNVLIMFIATIHLSKLLGSGGIRTHASEETGALNQRLRPLGHATFLGLWKFAVEVENLLSKYFVHYADG